MASLLDKDFSRSQSFHRRLLSEYNPEFTLDNYIDYFSLKKLAKKIENIVAQLSGYKDGETQRNDLRRTASALFPLTDNMDNMEMESLLASSMSRMRRRSSSTSPFSPDGMKRVGSASLLNGDFVLPQPSAQLIEERAKLQKDFFNRLEESIAKVSTFITNLEIQVAQHMKDLRQLSEKQIKQHNNPKYLEDLYLELQAIEKYRFLNLLAVQRLFHKFLTRCAHDSLTLQGEVSQLNMRVEKSPLVNSSIDLRGFILELISIFGIVHRLTYSSAISLLRQYEARRGWGVARILAPSDTFFFNNMLPSQKAFGTFSIKVLAGSTSQQMEKMLTAVLRCPRFSDTNSCSTFPNGEVKLDLTKPVRGDDVFIVQSTVHTPERNLTMNGSLMELALLINSAHLAGAHRITCVLPYLGYTRDIVSITAIAEIIENMGCQHLVTVDMDSEQVEGCFSIPMEIISAKMEFVRFIARQLTMEGNDFTKITIVAPRDLYLRRAKDFADALMREANLNSETQFVSVCTAVRRQNITSPSPPPQMTAHHHHTDPQDSTNHQKLSSEEEHQKKNAASCGEENHSTVSGVVTPHGKSGNSSFHRDELTDRLYPPDVLQSPLFQGNISTSGIESALALQEQGQRAIICSKKHGIEDECENEESSLQNIRLVGDVRGRLCVMVDTMIDEAVDTAAVSRCLMRNGAERIILVATHAILSGKAVERLKNSPVDLVIVSDSINQDAVMKDPALAKKLRIVPISPLLALAIEKIHTESKLPMLL